MPDAEAVTMSVPVMTVAGFLFAGAWGLVLWFLRRLVSQFDEGLRAVAGVRATVDSHALEIAQLRSELERLREDRQYDRRHVEDLVGFLRDQGFRKREG